VNTFDSSVTQWRKSLYSNGQGSCIEVGQAAVQAIAVRDTKDLDGPHLTFKLEAWEAFVNKVKRVLTKPQPTENIPSF
jgi:hypothetical protein